MGIKHLRIFPALLLLVVPQALFAANWQWMAPQRAFSLIKAGSGLWLVDVRSEASFAESHIEGAVNIPAALLATKRLPKGKVIVLEDDSLGQRKGREAAVALLKNGHEKVYLLAGGIPAWQEEKYPVAGKGSAPIFRSVMPDDITWAQNNRIPLRIFDVRGEAEQAQGPVSQAQAVEGNNLPERLEKVKTIIGVAGKKGLAAKLEDSATTILIFPTAVDPRPALERYLRGVPGDVRFLEGGYAAWAARPDKSISAVGACPTCPGAKRGGEKK
ncbi:MAG TPA: rhodanese-like domain-containing protein [Geobacteraceae bacterium]